MKPEPKTFYIQVPGALFGIVPLNLNYNFYLLTNQSRISLSRIYPDCWKIPDNETPVNKEKKIECDEMSFKGSYKTIHKKPYTKSRRFFRSSLLRFSYLNSYILKTRLYCDLFTGRYKYETQEYKFIKRRTSNERKYLKISTTTSATI